MDGTTGLAAITGAAGTAFGALLVFLTKRGERGLRVKLSETDRITAEIAQLRTVWLLEIHRLEDKLKQQDARLAELERQLDEKDRRIDHMETEIADLRDENTWLRAEVQRLGGTIPPRRVARRENEGGE